MSFRPVVRFWATGFFVIGALLAEIPFGQTLGWTQSVSPGAESTSIDLSPVFISRTARDKIDYSVIDHFTRRRQLSDDGDAAGYIGCTDGGGEFFHGQIDDVRIYKQALSNQDIERLSQGRSQVHNDALTGWWKLDGDLRNHAPISGAKPARTIGHDKRFVGGRLGKGIEFDGVQGGLRIGNYTGLKPTTNQITISAWIRPSECPDSWMQIYRKEDGDQGRQLLAIGKTAYYGLWCGLAVDGYVEVGGQIDRSTLADGNWHHVAATFDGKQIQLFHNGTEVGRAKVVEEEPVAAKVGDERLRIAFLGNTLVHRAAEFGYLESELIRLLPDDIVFRNLGWPGDTVTGSARVEFGRYEDTRGGWQRPDPSGEYGLRKLLSQVRREQPDVLILAYGSNVAFAGEGGLKDFAKGLERLLGLLEPTGVQVVLMTPPPRDIHADWPGDLWEQNKWLGHVAKHLQVVAEQRGLPLIDLFSRWHESGPQVKFTDNGIHLNQRGYRHMASILRDTLQGRKKPWRVHLHGDGTVAEATGTSAIDSAAQLTQYGMRWRLLDEALPSTVPNESQDSSADRLLKIDGLPDGTYSLDIDGRRVARATAQQWSVGVALTRGPDFQQVEAMRQAILNKNQLSFYRYRPQNKAYIHLFRKYERGHHAAEVERFGLLVAKAEEEISRLRVPSPRIYELVLARDHPDDELPGETFAASIDDEVAAFTVPEGFEIELFASDPMISKPLNINWDEQGRMWVATSTIYPHLQPGQQPNDRILILEDVDRDGRADKRTVFADQLIVPHSVIPGNGGAYVTQSTDLLFLRDNDGDGKADERRVLLTGFGNADVHHMIHTLRWGVDGDLYFIQSIYINSTVETPWGVRTSNGACIWRFRPDTLRLEQFAQGLVNPWGHAQDPWGQSFATDGAGGRGITYMFPGSAYWSHEYAGRELASLNPGRPNECALEFLSGRHLPEDWQGTFMTNDFRANRSTRYRLSESNSGYTSEFLGDMVISTHRGFRPIDVKVGPDGAIYIVDWYNVIIDHGEVDFHHPRRDKQHGRIWRLRAKDSPLLPRPQLADADVRTLLDALRVPEMWTRDQARRLLREKGAQAVMSELRQWVDSESLTDHDRLEALWVCQGLRVVEPSLLENNLDCDNPRVRAAAVRVLSDWYGRIPDSMKRLADAVADEHSQVRLEAINALRHVGTREAVETAFRAVDQPVDVWQDFALFRTAHQLRDVWLPDFQAGQPMFDGNSQRIAAALSAVGSDTSLAPLGELVRGEQLQAEPQIQALVVLSSFGGVDERELVLSKLPGLAAPDQCRVLTALVQSNRDAVPANAVGLQSLIDASDASVRELSMELVGRWQLRSALDSLKRIVRSSSSPAIERVVAGRAMLAIDSVAGADVLQDVYENATHDQVRGTALAALARGTINVAPLATQLFQMAIDTEVTALIAQAILDQPDGPKFLLETLNDDVRISQEVAQTVIQQARLSGRDLPELVKAIRRTGRLKPLSLLSAEHRAKLVQQVPVQGDVQRGEAVFRRSEMQCLTCHAVKGQGGKVGPELSSLGGGARVSDILESILDPSARIKDGFQTSHVFTSSGQMVSGILQQQTPDYVMIRAANDQLRKLPSDDIDEITSSQLSVMPTGLVDQLSPAELIDLLRYLSSLGRQVSR